jgi:hypothetical protein
MDLLHLATMEQLLRVLRIWNPQQLLLQNPPLVKLLSLPLAKPWNRRQVKPLSPPLANPQIRQQVKLPNRLQVQPLNLQQLNKLRQNSHTPLRISSKRRSPDAHRMLRSNVQKKVSTAIQQTARNSIDVWITSKLERASRFSTSIAVREPFSTSL